MRVLFCVYPEISVIPELPAGKRVFIRRRASILTSQDQANQEIELELFIIPVWANARITLIHEDPAEPRSVCVVWCTKNLCVCERSCARSLDELGIKLIYNRAREIFRTRSRQVQLYAESRSCVSESLSEFVIKSANICRQVISIRQHQVKVSMSRS